MEREYVRGNSKHWKEVYKYVYGIEPVANSDPGTCGDDTAIFVRNKIGGLTLYTDEILYDAITTNPHWHEVIPWKNKSYEPKPFDKVLAWDNNKNEVRPDIFLYKVSNTYFCARSGFNHVKPYDEEEYLKSLENSTDNE